MPESTSTRGKAAPQRAPATREPQPAHAKAPALAVRYWKRMHINKVYPFVVSWVGGGSEDSEPLTVRLLMAGAQVVPSELTMDPAHSRAAATFYVTPLAQGGLRSEKVEVLRQGKKIQEIRLPCSVASQRSTLVWLFLAFLVPALILHYFLYSPIGYKPTLNLDGTEKVAYRGSTAKTDKDIKQPWEMYDAKAEEATERLITQHVRDFTPNLKETLGGWYEQVQGFPGEAYVAAMQKFRGHPPVVLYIGLGLLLVALLSYVMRMERRKRVLGRPLPLGGEKGAE